MRLFTSLKSEIKRTVLFFFGIMKVGAAHSEEGCFFKTPSLTNRSTSSLAFLSECEGLEMPARDTVYFPVLIEKRRVPFANLQVYHRIALCNLKEFEANYAFVVQLDDYKYHR